jgi:hypothetical protein
MVRILGFTTSNIFPKPYPNPNTKIASMKNIIPTGVRLPRRILNSVGSGGNKYELPAPIIIEL